MDCSFFSVILFFLALSSSFATSDSSSSSSSNGTDTVTPALRVLVPVKPGFDQFVSRNVASPHNNATFDGFSVQVFLLALQFLKTPPPYVFVPQEHPDYDQMVAKVANGEADAIVADLTITMDRMESVDFTIPYIASALVMVTPLRNRRSASLWDFMRPFSLQLWLFLLVAFVATGGALYFLENNNPEFTSPPHDINKQDTPAHMAQTNPSSPAAAASQYPPHPSSPVDDHDPSSLQRPGRPIFDKDSHKHRILNAYWFTSLCLFYAPEEAVRTHSGRIVAVAWLFVVLVSNSSYTARLASILSAQTTYPAIEGFDALLKSNVAVGYQDGSFLKGYLTKMGFPQKRMRSYASAQEYAQALRQGPQKGGVGAILDELPYTQILLQSNCDFTKVGDQLAYFGGFGFAFRKNSTLTDEISKGILSLAENRTLHELKDKLIGVGDSSHCSSSDEPSYLGLRSFGGLFGILGGVYLICIMCFLLTKVSRRGRCAHTTDGIGIDANATSTIREEELASRSRRVSDYDGSQEGHDYHDDSPKH